MKPCLVARVYAERHGWSVEDAAFMAGCQGRAMHDAALLFPEDLCSFHRAELYRVGSRAFVQGLQKAPAEGAA